MADHRHIPVPRDTSPSHWRARHRKLMPAFTLMGALMAALGCARGPAYPWRAPAEPHVWPLPPDPPRIRHEGVIASGELGRFRNGAFSLLDLLFGGPKITFGSPHGIAADATTLAIADSSRAVIHLLDLERRRYRTIASAGKTPLSCPIGVALDGTGGLFVADSSQARVFHLSDRGRMLGEAQAKFVRPAGLAYDAARQLLHVVDAGAHSVLSFQVAAGGFRLVRTLGQRGQGSGSFNFPTHAAVAPDGTVHVADSLNHRVQMFGPDGKSLGAFGKAGDGTGDFAKAKGVGIDSQGRIYVVDSLYDVVQIFDRKGRCLLAFGGSGPGEGLLWLPTGIAIDGGDRIYVADSGNSRVQVYQYVRQSD